jgi:alpha-glucosidase (family GH31 glycosyl hydrolase)
MRTLVALILALSLAACQPASTGVDREYMGWEAYEDHVTVRTDDGHYRFVAYSDHIIETSFIPDGEQFEPVSHAVILAPQIDLQVDESRRQLSLLTAGMEVRITKQPFKISYFFKGKPLLEEGKGYYRDSIHEVLDLTIDATEVLWGGGARALGMNRRGHRLELYNKAHYGYETHSALMNFTMPLVFSSKGYGVHFDNAPIGYLDLDSQGDNSLKYETIRGRKTYQVIGGNDWYEIMDHYTRLTGRQPQLPRWAYGNFSSRFGYHSQEETERTIDAFIENEVPVDAVVLDLYWFGKEIKGTLGNFEFYKDSFPDPKGMIDRLDRKGVKTVLITEPFVVTTSDRWDEAVEADVLGKRANGEVYTYDFYFGHTGIIDIFKPEGRKWFWDVYQRFTEYGVSGWWGDLGEPEVHPSDLLHAVGTADEVHNIYGHEWAKLVYEGYEEHFSEQRPFILMRAGYSGSQRYGMIPWSGDVNRSWGGLQSQLEIALQMSMQGMAFMHSDLGGFANPNLDDELYVRWLQYGVFQPVYRPHAQEEVPSEPVFRTPEVLDLSRQAIALRYRMLPYNYTLGYLNHVHGQPLMRPLFFEEPENEELFNYAETYLWGPDILVSPVLEAGLSTQQVYFPKTSNWFDFYTGERFDGGQYLELSLNEDRIPTFVRGGAFIPLIPVIPNTEAYDLNDLEVHFYFDEGCAESSGKVFHDDGKTPNTVARKQFTLLEFHARMEEINNLNIKVKRSNGSDFFSSDMSFDLVIHNLNEAVGIPGHESAWDADEKTLSIRLTLKPDEAINLNLNLN